MATRSVPLPPFSTELLADLHAENVTPELREQLWPVVRDDPDAQRYLNSLDDVNTQLRAFGRDEHIIHPIPADIAAELAEFVEGFDLTDNPAEAASTLRGLPYTPDESDGTPLDSEEPTVRTTVTAPVSLDDRRPRRLRWLAAAAAATMVVTSATVLIEALRGNDSAPTAQPTTSAPLTDELNLTAALSALGRNDATGRLATPAALNRCVRANGIDRTILGSTDMTFQGKDAVLILLGGPRPRQITALVVGSGCTTDDPQQLTLTEIG